MCGIYGSTKIYPEDILDRKLKRIFFRGPDHSGYVRLEDNVILGHNRLTILDLDDRSNQPFQYKHIWIVFNGEIFNYKSIKADLRDKGYDFRTTSDTEVICAAYLEYQSSCVEFFNGMFSFVIYDSKRQILFGARDRVGKKPLYYSISDKGLEFASQMSSIAIGNSFPLSNLAIQKYLLRGYIEDPYSIYQGINKLPAGHMFTYNIPTREFDEERYWDLDLSPSKISLSYAEAKNQLKMLLEDAIKIRMISDVPLGTFLSGGIDSSLITAISAAQSSMRIKAFSVKFSEEEFDESEHAMRIARHIGVDHMVIPCSYKEGIELIENMNCYFDEPFGDSSAIPTMLLAKHTKQHITVALSGDGGDEIFMGYSRYKWIKRISSVYRLPGSVRKFISYALNISPNSRHKLISAYLKKRDIDDLIYDALINTNIEIFSIRPNTSTFFEYVLKNVASVEQKISDLDFKLWLCNDGLVKVDRGSMSASMEVRCPLLDYRIVELGRSLPVNYKYDGITQKKILKDILYDYVPKELFDRPKAGFTMPFKTWFRSELRDYVFDILTTDNLGRIPGLDVPFVQKNIRLHMKGETNFYSEIWKLLVLINWLNSNLHTVTKY